MQTEVIAFIGLLLGIIFRTASPYLRKIQAGEDIHWENRYLVAAVASLILCTGAALMTYPTLVIDTAAKAIAVFISAFIVGVGAESTIIEVGKWTEKAPAK